MILGSRTRTPRASPSPAHWPGSWSSSMIPERDDFQALLEHSPTRSTSTGPRSMRGLRRVPSGRAIAISAWSRASRSFTAPWCSR